MALFGLAPDYRTVPTRAPYDAVSPNGYFEHSSHVWQYLLAQPEVGPKEGACVRGCVFQPEAYSPTALNIESVHGLVLDVDEFRGQPIQQDQAAAVFHHLLEGHAFVAWTTYNHTREAPRYRLVVPLVQPLHRRKFRALWTLVNRQLGYVVGEGQWNANRLGYLPRLKNEAARADYQYWIHEGLVLDAEQRYGTLEETPDRISLVNEGAAVVDRSNWLSDDEAVGRARAYMRDAHVGINPGSRHYKLFEKACQLWYDYWLPQDMVTTVLREINARFSVPKADEDVLKEVEAGFAWVRGEGARPQQGGVPGFRRMRPPAVTSGQVGDLGRKLRRRQGQRDVGDALVLLAQREGYARVEEALAVSRSLARVLAEHYPQSDPAQIARLFASSIAIMRQQGGPQWPPSLTEDHIREVVHARQHELATQRQHAQNAQARQQSERIERAFAGLRATPYTTDEFHEYSRQHRCTFEQLRNQLIVQVHKSSYVFLGGTYSPPMEAYVEQYVLDALSAAEPLGVDLWRTSRTGDPQLRPVADLVRDYGVVAENLVVSLHDPFSRYDRSTKSFVHAVRPMRKLTPERNLEVEGYLNAIGSEHLLDWLAYVTQIDRPAKALYLWGAPDTGKSFFAMNLSRLWTEAGPSTGHDLFADFNDSLTRCPLVFLDEQMPSDLRGRRGTEMFRYQVQTTVRPYHAKFKAKAQLLGALRFVLAANHPNMIETDSTLTAHDAEGVRQRLEVIHVPEDAKRYLQSLGRERTERWLSDDLFAKHCLWLRDTRDLPPIGRFGPERGGPLTREQRDVYDSLRFSGGIGNVYLWLYKYLIGDVQLPGKVVQLVRVEGDNYASLGVNLEAVEQFWELVVGKQVRSPTRETVKTAFRAMRRGAARVYVGGKRVRYQILDLGMFHEWMASNECDVGLVEHKLGRMAQGEILEAAFQTGDE